MEFAFGHGAVAEEAAGDPIDAHHLVGQGHADRQGQMAGDDGVAAIEAGLFVEEVHGAATAPAASLLFAVEFGHDGAGRHASGESLAMLAIGGHEIVFRRQGLDYAHAHRLFTVVKVQEAADLHGAVELGRLLLQPADAQHLVKQM